MSTEMRMHVDPLTTLELQTNESGDYDYVIRNRDGDVIVLELDAAALARLQRSIAPF